MIAGITVEIGGGDGAGSRRGASAVKISAGVVDIVIFDGRSAVNAVDPTAQAASTGCRIAGDNGIFDCRSSISRRIHRSAVRSGIGSNGAVYHTRTAAVDVNPSTVTAVVVVDDTAFDGRAGSVDTDAAAVTGIAAFDGQTEDLRGAGFTGMKVESLTRVLAVNDATFRSQFGHHDDISTAEVQVLIARAGIRSRCDQDRVSVTGGVDPRLYSRILAGNQQGGTECRQRQHHHGKRCNG